MFYFNKTITAILLLNVCTLSAQKSYKCDFNFEKVSKYGPCSVEIFKYKRYYEVMFYDDSNYLVKKAKYERTFDAESMPFDNEYLFDTVVQFYKSGKIKKLVPYINGNKNGRELELYEDNTIQTERHYTNDIQDNKEISYLRNGDTLCIGSVINRIKNGNFLIKTLNNYYRIGVYRANNLRKIKIINFNNVISSEYLYKDTLNIQIIDSVIIYNILDTKIPPIKFRFRPGYRNLTKKTSNFPSNNNQEKDSFRVLFYKYSDDMYRKFLEDHLKYPRYCVERTIKGVVHVYFVVSREGHFLDIYTENNGVHQLLRDEALRVVNISDGDFIQKSMYPCIGTIPITFEIDDE